MLPRFLVPIFLILLTASLGAQTTTNKLSLADQLMGTNDPLRQSYEKQLTDFQKQETERILKQKLDQQKEAQEGKIKEQREQERAARLEQENQDLAQQKQELDQKELLSQTKEDLLAKYIAKLQQESAVKEKNLESNPSVSPATSQTDAAPAEATDQATNAAQEAMKPEPPN